KSILGALDSVISADEDRVLRRFLNVVEASLRTNYFQMGADGRPKPYLSVKFDSTRIDEMPLPRPLREIFVYSPRVEAIHLRGGRPRAPSPPPARSARPRGPGRLPARRRLGGRRWSRRVDAGVRVRRLWLVRGASADGAPSFPARSLDRRGSSSVQLQGGT